MIRLIFGCFAYGSLRQGRSIMKRVWKSWECLDQRRDLTNACIYLVGEWRRQRQHLSAAHWKGQRQWAKIDIYEIPLELMGEVVVVVRVSRIVSSYPERLCKYPWIHSTPDWIRPWVTSSSRPCFVVWTAPSLETPFHLNYSMINYGELDIILTVSCSFFIGDRHFSLIFTYVLFKLSSSTIIFGRTVFQFFIRLASV